MTYDGNLLIVESSPNDKDNADSDEKWFGYESNLTIHLRSAIVEPLLTLGLDAFVVTPKKDTYTSLSSVTSPLTAATGLDITNMTLSPSPINVVGEYLYVVRAICIVLYVLFLSYSITAYRFLLYFIHVPILSLNFGDVTHF